MPSRGASNRSGVVVVTWGVCIALLAALQVGMSECGRVGFAVQSEPLTVIMLAACVAAFLSSCFLVADRVTGGRRDLWAKMLSRERGSAIALAITTSVGLCAYLL